MNTQTENNIIPFSFQGMALRESCWIDGVPYFTRKSIGEFLGYAYPEQAITKIIERNPYLLQFRIVVNLTTIDGRRNVGRPADFFHPIGMQCVFFESHQPKAIEYKIAVASLVWELATGTLKPSKWSQKDDLVSAARQILSLPEGRKRAALIVDLTAREECSPQNTYRIIYKATGERLKTRKGVPRKTRSEAGSHHQRPEYQAVMAFVAEHPEYLGKGNQHKQYPKKAIRSILGLAVSEARINAWLREGKRKEICNG